MNLNRLSGHVHPQSTIELCKTITLHESIKLSNHGTNNLRGDSNFLLNFNRYLTEERRVDPATYELITIASCTGHSLVITREIPEGESDDIEYLTETSYAKYGSICHGTNLHYDQSILRNGLDVDFGVRAQWYERS